jgi:hypothetical protein
MAGLGPAIHVLAANKDVDARTSPRMTVRHHSFARRAAASRHDNSRKLSIAARSGSPASPQSFGPRCNGMHTALAVAQVDSCKKFVLLSIVAVRPPAGRLLLAVIPPRVSPSAITAPVKDATTIAQLLPYGELCPLRSGALADL